MKLLQRVESARSGALWMLYETERTDALIQCVPDAPGALDAILRVYPRAFVLEALRVPKGELERLRRLAPARLGRAS